MLNVGKNVEQQELSCIASGNIIGTTLENNLSISSKIEGLYIL